MLKKLCIMTNKASCDFYAPSVIKIGRAKIIRAKKGSMGKKLRRSIHR